MENTTIVKTNNWSHIKDHARNWVLLDIDQVVIEPCDNLFYRRLFETHRQRWKNDGIYEDKTSRILSNYTVRLVDPCIPSEIERFQKQGLYVMALTSFPTGSWGEISSMEDMRINQMQRLGIYFSSFFDAHIFDVFDPPYPIHKSGMILTAHHSKGDVLSSFLMKIETKPQHILFVDDRPENVEAVKNCCLNHGIDFTGIVFGA